MPCCLLIWRLHSLRDLPDTRITTDTTGRGSALKLYCPVRALTTPIHQFLPSYHPFMHSGVPKRINDNDRLENLTSHAALRGVVTGFHAYRSSLCLRFSTDHISTVLLVLITDLSLFPAYTHVEGGTPVSHFIARRILLLRIYHN